MTDFDKTRQMVELYRNGMSLEEVGRKFGITRQAVRERFIKAGVERRGKVKYNHREINKNQLEALYSGDRISVAEIARLFSVDRATIGRALKFHEIPKRRPLKTGGYIVDLLRNLEINENCIIERRVEGKDAHLHATAIGNGIKISLRALGNRRFKVTRVA
jgi:DNA invertase Pin-like site-specific DNA recombinase